MTKINQSVTGDGKVVSAQQVVPCHLVCGENAAAGHAIVRGALRVRQLLLSRLETAAHRTLQNTPEQRPPSNVNRLHLCQGAGWLHCQPYPDKVLAASPSLLPCLREKHADPGNPPTRALHHKDLNGWTG